MSEEVIFIIILGVLVGGAIAWIVRSFEKDYTPSDKKGGTQDTPRNPEDRI